MPPGYDPSAIQSAALDLSLLQMAVYAAAGMFMVLMIMTMLAVMTLPIFFGAMLFLEVSFSIANNFPDPIGKASKISGLVFRSLRRNLLRTALTYVALFVLTGMLTLIYSVVAFLGKITEEKEENVQVIMTEKFQIPSQMPPGYAEQLKGLIQTKLPPESRPKNVNDDFMTWSFVGGSMDPNNRTMENSMFMFCLEPHTIITMMDSQGLSKDDLSAEGYAELVRGVELMKQDKRNIIVGQERLKLIGKKVGDDIKLYGLNYKDIEFDFKIVASFPSESRLGMSAAMRYDYLLAKLDEYKIKKGQEHPVAQRCVNLIWVRLPNKKAYEQLAAVVNEPGSFSAPAVKMETASAGIASFLDAFKDIFWGMKFIVMPAIMVIMCLVVGITITIGVRERWTEMAVMKVLGFQPWQVMSMITGEAVLIGIFGGMLSTWAVYFIPLFLRSSGLKMQIAFFSNFKAPWEIVIYGPILGIVVGLIGSAVPSWSARKVKVSEVFAKVA